MAGEPLPADSESGLKAYLPTTEERNWALCAHLAAFLGYVLFMLSFLGPLVVWLLRKDTSPFVDHHGKESLNFQINFFGYFLVSVLIAIMTCGIGLIVVIPLWGFLAIYGIVMPIVGAIKASNGEWFRYPFVLRIVG